MHTTIERARIDLIPSFHGCLHEVAQEKRFIELIEAPPLDDVLSVQTKLIETGAPATYAINGSEVVGWCDIMPYKNPRLAHRGGLGMGLKKEFRGRGLGRRLLEQTLMQARLFGLDKVELSVYTSNLPAIRLYQELGFEPEGLLKAYRKLEGQTFDCLMMAKFLLQVD